MNINQARQTSHDSPKGQEILEFFFIVFNSSKKERGLFFSTSTLASIKWSNKKIIMLDGPNYHDKMLFFFDSNTF